MTISAESLWNFEDFINLASRIYCLKISSNNCTDFEEKKSLHTEKSSTVPDNLEKSSSNLIPETGYLKDYFSTLVATTGQISIIVTNY